MSRTLSPYDPRALPLTQAESVVPEFRRSQTYDASGPGPLNVILRALRHRLKPVALAANPAMVEEKKMLRQRVRRAVEYAQALRPEEIDEEEDGQPAGPGINLQPDAAAADIDQMAGHLAELMCKSYQLCSIAR